MFQFLRQTVPWEPCLPSPVLPWHRCHLALLTRWCTPHTLMWQRCPSQPRLQWSLIRRSLHLLPLWPWTGPRTSPPPTYPYPYPCQRSSATSQIVPRSCRSQRPLVPQSVSTMNSVLLLHGEQWFEKCCFAATLYFTHTLHVLICQIVESMNVFVMHVTPGWTRIAYSQCTY